MANRPGGFAGAAWQPFAPSVSWLLPPGDGPFPAVLVVYYEPETSIGVGDQPLRDFAVVVALSDQPQHLPLAIGQFGENGGMGRGARGGEVVHQPGGDGRAEDGLPSDHGVDGADDVVFVGVLQHLSLIHI